MGGSPEGGAEDDLESALLNAEETGRLNSPTSSAVSSSSPISTRDQRRRKEEITDEAKKQLGLAGPLVGVSLLQYCLQVISLMYVGHLGELPLSGASMATSFASVTGFSVLIRLVKCDLYNPYPLLNNIHAN
ncbi:hypothetical protein CRG98_010198 [Punica granatum]|uniref:Uncharacterized protein n=1 Tax=Punica granatum TaxID=22663 RepID=A0A2I0KM31_PUNGR|nr:hypothetical protein CRG98_010198 [Punica granatum]